MDNHASPNRGHPTDMELDSLQRKAPSLDTLPLECIQAILRHLSLDGHALFSLMLINRTWFNTVVPFLYKSPMVLIDATWPKISPYCQILKKDPPLDDPSPLTLDLSNTSSSSSSPQQPQQPHPHNHHPNHHQNHHSQHQQQQQPGPQRRPSQRTGSNPLPPLPEGPRSGRTGRASISNNAGSGAPSSIYSAPRTQSRSSSHSSTRSWTADILPSNRDRYDAVHTRESLIKRKKLQVLWVLLNCTISEEEHEAKSPAIARIQQEQHQQQLLNHTEGESTAVISAPVVAPRTKRTKPSSKYSSSSLLSLNLNPDLEIALEFFKPMVDYMSYYTHQFHPGLRFIIWKLFPSIEDAFSVELRLISHCPERIRELYLESVQLQDLVHLAPRLECLHRIRTCHESWDVAGSIGFMQEHNKRFGTVRMLELEAYLPETYDTTMDDHLSDLISTVDHLRVLELSGFEVLIARLDLIPMKDLKVLKLNCGSLNPTISANSSSTVATHHANGNGGSGGMDGTQEKMTISTFLSQCRQLEDLVLKSVDENMLEWAVKERKDFQSGALSTIPSSPSAPISLSQPQSCPALVPLRTIELSGIDSEHVAMNISQAAEAFQETLEVIKANSYSYVANRTLTSLSWKCLMPRLRVLKIVGRSNLPFDFGSLQHCPALQIFDVSKYSGMRSCSEAMLLNMKYLTKLEYLGLSSFDHLTDSSLKTILGCMPRLKHLRLAIGDTPASTSSSSVSAPSALSAVGISSTAGNASSSSLLSSASSGMSTFHSLAAAAVATSSSNFNPSLLAGTAAPNTIATTGATTAGIRISPLLTGDLSLRAPFFGTVYPSGGPSSDTGSVSSLSSSTTLFPGDSRSVAGSSHSGSGVSSAQPALSTFSTSMSSTSSSSFSNSSSPPPPLPAQVAAASSQPPQPLTSMLERFHLESQHLTLQGIMDAIDSFSGRHGTGYQEQPDHQNEPSSSSVSSPLVAPQRHLEKLSIVLGKLDFEEHYRRLEEYNQTHLDLDITVYRYAHGV